MPEQEIKSKKARYGEYCADTDRAEIAVRVTAADFNGVSFDGSPFSCLPQWLKDALADGALFMHCGGERDYATWGIVTHSGIVNAEPGDYILRRERGDLSVVPAEDAHILINLRPPVEDQDCDK